MHLLYLATRAGARALGLEDRIGDFAVGKDFNAVWLRPADGSTLAVNLRHARDTTDALARIFALATPADVAGRLDPRRVARCRGVFDGQVSAPSRDRGQLSALTCRYRPLPGPCGSGQTPSGVAFT